MNIILFSNHWYLSPRKAGFHHLADAWHKQGHNIIFVTVGFSIISWLRRDFRVHYPGIFKACNQWQHIKERFESYVFFTAWHPHTTLLPYLDHLLASYMASYDQLLPQSLIERIRNADILVYESCAAIYLFSRCSELAPNAKHIYRVSDDIRTMRSTPCCMIDIEQQLAPKFSAISVPCHYLFQKFSKCDHVYIHHHGLNKELFDSCQKNPYKKHTYNVVFCGLGFYDLKTVHTMAQSHSNIFFHIIGINRPKKYIPSNVCYYGELPFIKTISYIKYADVGLYTLQPSISRPMGAYTDSLKIIQYRYCGLPIVSPDFLNLHRQGIFYYEYGNTTSYSNALEQALHHGRHKEYSIEVDSWSSIAEKIIDCSSKF